MAFVRLPQMDGIKPQDSLWPSVTMNQAPCAVTAISHETQAQTSPRLHHLHHQLLLVSARGRSGGWLRPLGTGLAHGCRSEGKTFRGCPQAPRA